MSFITEDDPLDVVTAILVVAIIFVIALCTVGAASPRVSIKVQGGGTSIACTVPRHSDNRLLVIGVAERVSSERQLEGEAAPVTHRLDLRQLLPCEGESALTAFCQVLWVPGSPKNVQVATLNIPCDTQR